MLDTASILAIISLIATTLIGSHYAVRSECFGFVFRLSSNTEDALEVVVGDTEMEITHSGKLKVNDKVVGEIHLGK